MGAAEVARGSFFEGASFLVSDDHDFASSEFGKAGEHGSIITEELIAMELDELVKGQIQIVLCVGAILMPRDLDDLPWGELRVGFAGGFCPTSAQLSGFFLLGLAWLGHGFELAQSSFDVEHGLFELKSFGCCTHNSF